MGRFTTITGLSEIRRFPRLGKIGLGIKAQSKGGRDYPKEVDYFVFDPPAEDASEANKRLYAKFRKVYGDKPTALNVIIPSEDVQEFFPQALKLYGSNHRIRCTGNGGGCAMREKGLFPKDQQAGKDDGALYEWTECPCELFEEGKCKQMGNLMVMIPDVSVAGYFQIDTSSFHSIVGINSDLAYIRNVFGRVSNMVSLRTGQTALQLIREPKETFFEGKSATHWPMRLVVRNAEMLDFHVLQQLRLAAPGRGLMLQAPAPETELIPGNAMVPTTAQLPPGVDDVTGEIIEPDEPEAAPQSQQKSRAAALADRVKQKPEPDPEPEPEPDEAAPGAETKPAAALADDEGGWF